MNPALVVAGEADVLARPSGGVITIESVFVPSATVPLQSTVKVKNIPFRRRFIFTFGRHFCLDRLLH